MHKLAVGSTIVTRIQEGKQRASEPDLLAVEEPLEIRIGYGNTIRKEMSLAVTMRTPGNDFELVQGFLFTESIIQSPDDILSIRHCENVKPEERENVVRVELLDTMDFQPDSHQRNFYTTSSCGVCGKSSIEAIHSQCALLPFGLKLNGQLIHQSPDVLRKAQQVFEHTGGLHAVGLFDKTGKLLLMREDVGRHNAFDKLVGAMLTDNVDPKDTFVLVSGRASFELVQKAIMARVSVMAAVGAPSSLAVDLAEQSNLTLVGFVRNKTFNIYTHAQRIESS